MLAENDAQDADEAQLRSIHPFGSDIAVVRLMPGRLGIVAWRGGRPILLVAADAPVASVLVARHLVDEHPPGLDDETWEALFCERDECEQARQWMADAERAATSLS